MTSGRSGVHPTAIVEDGARLGADVRVGPYCIIGADVELGDGVDLIGHVVVSGHTRIGPGTRIWPFASIGHRPQDLKYAGETSYLEIGADNMIREHVTMSPGTTGGGLVTRVGDGGLFMVGAHVGHDCRIGSNVVMANNATLAGHVEIGDFAILGGLSAVHQHVRIGGHAIVGGMTGVDRDVIPFGSAVGNRAELGGLNAVGLRRRGFDHETVHMLREAYRAIFSGDGSLAERAAAAARRWDGVGPVQEMAAFILADTARSFCTPRTG
ncbi:MAG TPA: acyl-ACP--UDP-N-acetylglucosamine O-acyltransferase [Paracoccaceae bacterium]|nr:acyl-ACP--UDP-N-acetylglucosamine O-acyltransferase [Paracoccaceae bacterium]